MTDNNNDNNNNDDSKPWNLPEKGTLAYRLESLEQYKESSQETIEIMKKRLDEQEERLLDMWDVFSAITRVLHDADDMTKLKKNREMRKIDKELGPNEKPF